MTDEQQATAKRALIRAEFASVSARNELDAHRHGNVKQAIQEAVAALTEALFCIQDEAGTEAPAAAPAMPLGDIELALWTCAFAASMVQFGAPRPASYAAAAAVHAFHGLPEPLDAQVDAMLRHMRSTSESGR